MAYYGLFVTRKEIFLYGSNLVFKWSAGRAKFGVEWDVKPVFNDEEVIKRNKQVAEEIAAMG